MKNNNDNNLPVYYIKIDRTEREYITRERGGDGWDQDDIAYNNSINGYSVVKEGELSLYD